MATTSPPTPPAAPPPPPPSGPPAPEAPLRAPRTGPVRIIALGALGLVVLIVAYLVFGGSSGANYKLIFAEADQLVRGDQVEVAGTPVGSVKDIVLTPGFKAEVTIHVNGSLVPLHVGTVAQVRVPSLTTVADRYIELTPGPNSNPAYREGATLPASATKEVTDLDALFNTLNPKTRKGLQGFIQGTAEQFAGQGRNLRASTEYFAPALTSTDHFISQLVRDQPVFTHFLIETAKAVTTIGARQESVADLVENQNKTFQAVGSEQAALAQGLKKLPVTLNQGNKTFAELPATFAALTELVNAARPTTPSLNVLFERLRPLLSTATPVVHNFSEVFSKPGPNNDLTDLANDLPALAKQLTTTSPISVTALKETVPISAVFGPYSPDLAGTLRTFGAGAGYYDADGHYVHVNGVFPDFKVGEKEALTPAASAPQALEGLVTGQLRRCPGSATQPTADGSSPFADGEMLSCDPSELPVNRRRSSLAASPLLIGAITTLIVVVAVFLSYNANNGLPFVPTYNVKVELPEAAGLQQSNQVRIAGTRVGLVSSMKPHQNPRTGRVTAIAELHLEKKVEPLPADTKAIVQSVSTVGLKYLELIKGNSSQTLKPGHTIPISQTREPVNIEELFNMFNKPTRTAIKINSNNFGDGLAGRGLGLNNTIAELRPLVIHAVPALHNLALPATGLHELWVALDRVASQTAPVAQQNAEYFTNLDIFFKEWASVAPSIEAANKGGPASLEQAIYSLPHEAPFYENAAEFMHLLRPSAESLKTVAPELGHAFSVGATNLAAATALNTQLAEASKALNEFAHNPVVTLAFEDFTETLEIGNPLLAGIAPEQETCNYWTLAFRNLASLESESVGVGTLARASTLLSPIGPNNEGFPSAVPANGPDIEKESVTSSKILANNHLHYNPNPNTTAPGQPDVCEAANETYVPGKLTVGNLPASDVTNNREITNREDNLLGEKYPAATLKALGLAKAPTKTKSKGKGA